MNTSEAVYRTTIRIIYHMESLSPSQAGYLAISLRISLSMLQAMNELSHACD
jgi:hypothetical protein